MGNPVYLDCAATTPIEPRVIEVMLRYLQDEFGNSGSRTHEYGVRANQSVQKARDQVAAVVDCQRDEVIFTSGATESNNLALLGLRSHLEEVGRRHVITSAIEHKAVLEPLQELERFGFSVTYLSPSADGFVPPARLAEALRPDTGLVSLMHVNNETGAIQPVTDYALVLAEHAAFFHVDAAQGFGKCLNDLRSTRIDLISVSGHKICGPKGVGALIARRRGFERLPLRPLMFGGGQERGLRPGTLPVPLVVGFGVAAELAAKEHRQRRERCEAIRQVAVKALTGVGGILTVPDSVSIASTLSISFPKVDSESLMVAVKSLVAISNGAACTSQNYHESHVLTAMSLPPDVLSGTIRISWCHTTPDLDWTTLSAVVRQLH